MLGSGGRRSKMTKVALGCSGVLRVIVSSHSFKKLVNSESSCLPLSFTAGSKLT